MSKIFAVTSSKGGVGKSTISNHLARTMANAGEKTLVIETDSGLRGLDIFFNMKNIVYDISDVISNRCTLENAIQTDLTNENLALLPAPFNIQTKLTFNELNSICKNLSQIYDNLIIDLNGDCELNAQTVAISDLVLIVTTPDPVCVRDVSIFVSYLKGQTEHAAKMRLIVNKMQKKFVRKNIFKNLDEIIDEISLQLIGVILQSNKLEIANFCGQNLKKHCLIQKIFDAIYCRINKNNKRLLI